MLTAILGGVLLLEGIGGLTIGTIVAYLQFTKSFTQPFMQVAQQFNAIIMALAGAERIFRMMDEEPEVDDGYVTLVNAKKDADGNIIECEERTGMWAWKHPHQADGTVTYTELKGDVRFYDMSFGYTPDKMVLHDLTLYAKPGQKLAFVGSTGAGKTDVYKRQGVPIPEQNRSCSGFLFVKYFLRISSVSYTHLGRRSRVLIQSRRIACSLETAIMTQRGQKPQGSISALYFGDSDSVKWKMRRSLPAGILRKMFRRLSGFC